MLNASEKFQASPWYQLTTEGGVHSLKLSGSYTLAALTSEIKKLSSQLTYFANQPNIQWDLTGIDALDHVGLAMIWRSWGKQRPTNLLLRIEQEKLFDHLAQSSQKLSKTKWQPDLLWPVVFLGKRFFLFWNHLTGDRKSVV